MNTRKSIFRIGLISAGCTLLAHAQEIAVDSYTATPSTSPAYEDTGGVELTDSDPGAAVWPGAAVTPPLVGWQNIDAEATFNFAAPVTIGRIVTWFADSDGNAGVGLPESVRVSTTGGFDQLFPVPNPEGSGTTVAIELTGFVITTDNVTLSIARDTALDNPVCCGGTYEWTMLAEVDFFEGDAATAQLTAPAAVDLGILPDDPAETTRTISIGNASGVAEDLVVTGLNFSGPDEANFTAGDLPGTLTPGESAEISFTFDSGGVEGSYAATLEIASNDPDSPTSVEITARVIAPLVPSTAYQRAVVADNPVLYWTFDEAGDTDNARSMVNDLPANELIARGAATRGPSTVTAGGVDLGRAAHFDTLADPQSRFNADNLSPTTPLDAFVVELWFNIDDTADRYLSETFAEGGGSNQPGVIYNFNAGEFEIFAGGRTGTPLTANEWHHVVAAYYGSGNGVEIFIDGVSAPLTDREGGYAQVQSFGRFAIGNTVQNPQAVTGAIDEYAIYDLGDFPDLASMQAHAAKIASHFSISGGFPLSVSGDGANLTFEWESQSGMFYQLRSSTDLAADFSTWELVEVDGSTEIDSTPPANSLTIPRPAEPVRFYRVEELRLPPVVVFSDDFESGQGSWTTGSEGEAGTMWELGTPSNVGPAGANSGASCFATNLDATYGLEANVWLRSPAIDLTGASGATLTYAQFTEIEEMFDSGVINVLDASDDSVIAEVRSGIDGIATAWETVSQPLPAEALDKIIKVEFRLFSDDFTNEAGWYLDDVMVSTPAP